MKNLILFMMIVFVSSGLSSQVTVNADSSLDVSGQVYRKIAHVTGFGPTGIDVGLLPGRNLVFNKKYSDTSLRVSYTDNVRVNGSQSQGACRWEIYFNNQPCTQPAKVAHDIYVNAGNEHRPATLVGYCSATASGSFDAGDVINISVRVSSSPGYNSDCYTGWQTDVPFLIEVEEVR